MKFCGCSMRTGLRFYLLSRTRPMRCSFRRCGIGSWIPPQAKVRPSHSLHDILLDTNLTSLPSRLRHLHPRPARPMATGIDTSRTGLFQCPALLDRARPGKHDGRALAQALSSRRARGRRSTRHQGQPQEIRHYHRCADSHFVCTYLGPRARRVHCDVTRPGI